MAPDRIVPPLTREARAAFVAAARSYKGTPFRHRGRSRRVIDCLGLCVCALRDIGLSPADERVYQRHPEPEAAKLRATLVEHFGSPVQALEPGCIVTLQWHGRANHVGIIGDYPLGGMTLLHTDAQVGRVVEHRLATHWPRRVIEGWLP